MELEAGSGTAARRTGRLNNDRGPARMLTPLAGFGRHIAFQRRDIGPHLVEFLGLRAAQRNAAG